MPNEDILDEYELVEDRLFQSSMWKDASKRESLQQNVSHSHNVERLRS